MSRHQDDPVKFGFIALVAGGVLLYNSLKNFRKARQIEDVARIDIGSAPMGLVEVEGYAWPAGRSMPSVSGHEVVYYSYKVEEYVYRGKNSSWETRYEFNFTEPFYVMDASGICLVNPGDGDLDVTAVTTQLRGYATDVAGLRALVGSAFLGRSYRLIEKKIAIGSPAYVCGDMRPLSGTFKIKGDFRSFLQRALLQKRGAQNNEMQMLAGVSANLRNPAAGAEIEVRPTGLISGTDNHNLILADCHQSELLQRVSSFNYFKMAGGIALIGFAVYIFTNMNKFS